jgi:branched-chain amino acid aminotransferase
MVFPQQKFFLVDSKIHTVASSACVLPPPDKHVYEVFRVIKGVPLFLEDHLQRLENSMTGDDFHCDLNLITNEVKLLMKLNQFATGNIKIILWTDGEKTHSMIFYDKHEYPDEKMFSDGITIGILERERHEPNRKVFDPVMRKDALSLIEDNRFYEVLLQTSGGFITEGSRSNVFLIQNDVIYTPPSQCVLEGVTRKKVISIILKLNLKFEEKMIHVKELYNYESIFLTGTSRRVLPVKKIEPFPFVYQADHQLIRLIRTEFISLCDDYIASEI